LASDQARRAFRLIPTVGISQALYIDSGGEDQDISGALLWVLISGKFGVRAFPTLLFFRDGQVQKQIVGAQSKAKIKMAIDHSM